MLPQASATGNIHIGTMAGKLNGVMPATTPSGWRSEWLSTPRADILGELALQQLRDAAGELDDLEAARGSRPWRRDRTLPCSAVMSAASSSMRSSQHALEAVEDARAAQRRRGGPAREGRAWRQRPRRRTSAVLASAPVPSARRSPG